MSKIIRLLFLALPLLFSLPLSAAESGQPVKAQIYSEETAVQPGRPFWVAVRLDIDEGWHAYWKNPGDAGFASSIDWQLPEGFEAEEIRWPTPERIEAGEGINYGYHDAVTLLTKVTPPDTIKEGEEIEIDADLTWLVCSDTSCLPGSQPLSLTLKTTADTPEINADAAAVFSDVREKLPSEHRKARAKANDRAIELELTGFDRSFDHAYFYPEMSGVVRDVDEIAVNTSESGYVFRLPVDEEADSSGQALKGLLVLKNSSGGQIDAIEVSAPVLGEGEEVAMAGGSTSAMEPSALQFQGGFFWALLLAFAGGAILNLMPCVLPVISLKIFSFVKMAGESRWKVAKHGLLFTLGVLVSFWTLAGVLISLQAYGQMVGWGFQLQEPIFVALLAALLFVFGLSLFGLFEVGTMFSSWAGQKESDAKQGNGGAASAFMSGVLATAVATPCTGPFLGSALGFAMTLSAPLSLMIFTSIALGMSFPYLLISAYPPLIRFLPKPGKWMVTFKEFLGFCMIATTLWLVWVFGAQTGYDALFTLLSAFLILSVACWIYGKWASPMQKRPVRIAALTIALLIGVFGFYEVVRSSAQDFPSDELVAMADVPSGERNIRNWEPFSKQRLEELKKQGKPVFIDFTAKWCLICQTNHKVLENQEVADEMARRGVVKMLADWTKKNPEISEELRKFGRSSVPLYILYGTDGKTAILPQVLTPDTILDYLGTIEE
jgi:thiol:disulfide interchange protein